MWKVGGAQCCSSLHDLFFWVANLFFLKPFSHIQIALSARADGVRRMPPRPHTMRHLAFRCYNEHSHLI